MKRPEVISVVALIVSLSAGFLAIHVSRAASEAEINARVDARIAARELKFVDTYAPKLREMCAAVGDPEFGQDWHPKTLEELVAPITKITTSVESGTK